MGLTIHYKLRLTTRISRVDAEALVHNARRRAQALVRRRGLESISPVQPADPEDPWHCKFVTEKRGDDFVGYDVPPICGWLFFVHLGLGCESALFGLCLHPPTIDTGRRKLRTGCTGWGYSGFCKTQYASQHGPENFLKCHRAVIDLLLIWERLGVTVTIKDEGGYWPGRHEAKLLGECGQMNRMVAALGGALKDAADDGETVARMQSPIFEHPQFEKLEAEGLSQNAAQINRAMKIIAGLGGHPDARSQPPTP